MLQGDAGNGGWKRFDCAGFSCVQLHQLFISLTYFFFQYHIFILLGLMYIEVINSKDRREENAEDNVN